MDVNVGWSFERTAKYFLKRAGRSLWIWHRIFKYPLFRWKTPYQYVCTLMISKAKADLSDIIVVSVPLPPKKRSCVLASGNRGGREREKEKETKTSHRRRKSDWRDHFSENLALSLSLPIIPNSSLPRVWEFIRHGRRIRPTLLYLERIQPCEHVTSSAAYIHSEWNIKNWLFGTMLLSYVVLYAVPLHLNETKCLALFCIVLSTFLWSDRVIEVGEEEKSLTHARFLFYLLDSAGPLWLLLWPLIESLGTTWCVTLCNDRLLLSLEHSLSSDNDKSTKGWPQVHLHLCWQCSLVFKVL